MGLPRILVTPGAGQVLDYVNAPGGWDRVLRAIVVARADGMDGAAIGRIAADRDMIVLE